MTAPNLPYAGGIANKIKIGRFDLALELCKSKGISSQPLTDYVANQISTVTDLLKTEKYDQALQICITSIGITAPPKIIDLLFRPNLQQYLLRRYLIEVHKRGYANGSLTSLLFNLFVQSQARDELTSFIDLIKSAQAEKKRLREKGAAIKLIQKTESPIDYQRFLQNFDVEAAIETLNVYGMEEEVRAISCAVGISIHLISSMIYQDKKYIEAATEIFNHFDEPIGKTMLMKFGPLLLQMDQTAGKLVEQTAAEMWRSDDSLAERPFINLFWGFPQNCLRFLKNVVAEKPTKLFGTILVELLIPFPDATAESFFGNPAVANADLALSYMGNPAIPLEEDHLVTVCADAGFSIGVAQLLTRAQRANEALDYLLYTKKTMEIVEWVKRNPKLEKDQWAQIFRIFVAQREWTKIADNEAALSFVTKVAMNASQFLAPNYVTQQLLKSPELPFSVLQPCIKASAARITSEDNQLRGEYSKLSAELRKVNDQIKRLSTEKVDVSARKCSHCNEDLATPYTYFMCGHAFHSKCLSSQPSGAAYCSICGPAQSAARDDDMDLSGILL